MDTFIEQGQVNTTAKDLGAHEDEDLDINHPRLLPLALQKFPRGSNSVPRQQVVGGWPTLKTLKYYRLLLPESEYFETREKSRLWWTLHTGPTLTLLAGMLRLLLPL